MRILIISTFFPPLNSVASLRPYSWAKYWSQAGHDVTVLTTEKHQRSSDLKLPLDGFEIIEVPLPPFFGSLKKHHNETTSTQSISKTKSVKNSLFNAFETLRNKTGLFNACRFPDMTHFWIANAWEAIASKGHWDLIVSSSGPYPVHLLARKLKQAGLTSQWIADFRDLWVDNHIYPGIWPFRAYEKHLEGKIAKEANLLTTVSLPLANQLQIRYPQARVTVVENGFDPSDLEALEKTSIFPANSKYRLVYTGSIYPEQNPKPLFQAIQSLQQEQKTALLDRLEVIFVGDRHATIHNLIQQYRVQKWVTHQGKVSRETALRMQRDGNCLLFLPYGNEEGILSGKLFEYLTSQTPLICIGGEQLTDVQKLIVEMKAGLVLGSDVNAIKAFLEENLSRKEEKQKNLLNEEMLTFYTRKSLAEKMLAPMQ